MPPISSKKTPRRLVLGRETVRTLAHPRSQDVVTVAVGDTSGTCACGTHTH